MVVTCKNTFIHLSVRVGMAQAGGSEGGWGQGVQRGLSPNPSPLSTTGSPQTWMIQLPKCDFQFCFCISIIGI